MTDTPKPQEPDRPKKTADMAAYRATYRANYRETHCRPTLTLTRSEQAAFARVARATGQSVPRCIKALAQAKLREHQGHVGEESLTDARLPEALFLVRNMANNMNQIARQLNLDAKQGRGTGQDTRPNESSARAVLVSIFAQLRTVEQRLLHLTTIPAIQPPPGRPEAVLQSHPSSPTNAPP